MTRNEFLQSKILHNDGTEYLDYGVYDFSTWQGFCNLWKWSKGQEWWSKFVVQYYAVNWQSQWSEKQSNEFIAVFTTLHLINPDTLADAVAKYLGWEE